MVAEGHYKRYNTTIKNLEHIASGNFEGAQLDNEDYFEQMKVPNLTTCDKCLYLVESSWLELYLQIDNIEYTSSQSIYEIYMYHGYKKQLGLNLQTEIQI